MYVPWVLTLKNPTFCPAEYLYVLWIFQKKKHWNLPHTCTPITDFFFSWRYNPLWVCILQPSGGLEPPRVWGFLITHNDAPQSVGLLWTSDQSVAETSTWQHTTLTTDKHPCPSGIRTHDLSRRAAIDLRLRPRGHWDRHQWLVFITEETNVYCAVWTGYLNKMD